jgi:hypothetical protein
MFGVEKEMKILLFLCVFLTGCDGLRTAIDNVFSGSIPPDARAQFVANGGNTIEVTDVSPGVTVSSSVTTGRNADGSITFPIVCASGQQVLSSWNVATRSTTYPTAPTAEDKTFWLSQVIIINYDPGAFTCGHRYRFDGLSVGGFYTADTAQLVPGYGARVRVVFTDVGPL